MVLLMLHWDKNFHDISISYDEKMIHIKTDVNLLNFLALPKNGSLQIADYILNKYQIIYGKTLEITRDSLAIEILAHAYIDIFSSALIALGQTTKHPTIRKAIKMLDTIQSKTEIIDCGELSVDNNRHIWDSLVPYHTAIFAILGRLS